VEEIQKETKKISKGAQKRVEISKNLKQSQILVIEIGRRRKFSLKCNCIVCLFVFFLLNFYIKLKTRE
jgi:hypothetical protein